jgi:hypothetical protein
MTKQHRVTPEEWESIELHAEDNLYDACLLLIHARIEALEAGATCPHVRSSDEGTSYCALAEAVAAPQPPLFTAEEVARIVAPTVKESLTDPSGPLVERVADAIAAQATSAGIVNDRPARAAILEVAAWLDQRGQHGCSLWLRDEANR